MTANSARKPPRDVPPAVLRTGPDLPDHVPADLLPGDGTSFPWN